MEHYERRHFVPDEIGFTTEQDEYMFALYGHRRYDIVHSIKIGEKEEFNGMIVGYTNGFDYVLSDLNDHSEWVRSFREIKRNIE